VAVHIWTYAPQVCLNDVEGDEWKLMTAAVRDVRLYEGSDMVEYLMEFTCDGW
jgi:hypothetical protein